MYPILEFLTVVFAMVSAVAACVSLYHVKQTAKLRVRLDTYHHYIRAPFLQLSSNFLVSIRNTIEEIELSDESEISLDEAEDQINFHINQFLDPLRLNLGLLGDAGIQMGTLKGLRDFEDNIVEGILESPRSNNKYTINHVINPLLYELGKTIHKFDPVRD